MNSLKKGEPVPLLNFEGVPGVPLVNFRGVPGPKLNFEGVAGSRGPGLWGPVPIFTPCQTTNCSTEHLLHTENY